MTRRKRQGRNRPASSGASIWEMNDEPFDFNIGNSVIAHAMGTDEEMTMPMMEPVTITVCETCALGDVNIMVLAGME